MQLGLFLDWGLSLLCYLLRETGDCLFGMFKKERAAAMSFLFAEAADEGGSSGWH